MEEEKGKINNFQRNFFFFFFFLFFLFFFAFFALISISSRLIACFFVCVSILDST